MDTPLFLSGEQLPRVRKTPKIAKTKSEKKQNLNPQSNKFKKKPRETNPKTNWPNLLKSLTSFAIAENRRCPENAGHLDRGRKMAEVKFSIYYRIQER